MSKLTFIIIVLDAIISTVGGIIFLFIFREK